MFGTFFLKINTSLLNQEFEGKKTWFFIFVFYKCLFQILCFTAASTKPLECTRYFSLSHNHYAYQHTIHYSNYISLGVGVALRRQVTDVE